MTAPASAYPRTVDDLMPEARMVPVRDGERVPSQRRLMTALNIGQDKAREVRARLIEEGIRRDLDERVGPLLDPSPSPDGHGPDAGDTEPEPTPEPEPPALPAEPVQETTAQPRVDADTDDTAAPAKTKPVAVWPVLPLALPAFVALWAGWVDLGRLTGFGPVNLLPGIAKPGEWATIDSSITLPIGMETYAAYALYVWLSGRVPERARRFAMWSAIISLAVGALGQVAYHLLIEAGETSAPWWITTAVSCLPVAVLGMGAALAHLVRAGEHR